MIFITGASSGIGAACARKFAEEGQALLLAARRGERLEALAKELRDRHRIEVKTLVLDVTDREAVEALGSRADLLESVSVLVNSAGLAAGFGPIQEGKISDWEIMLDTNVRGLLGVTRAILPFLIRRRKGHIINIGSVAGQWAYPGGNIYCATKAAVASLTQSLRMDLNGTGIRVTEIAPGMVETEFSEVRFGDKKKASAVYQGMRPLTGQDIADAVVWAASRPERINIQQMVIYSTDQASPTLVHRGE